MSGMLLSAPDAGEKRTVESIGISKTDGRKRRDIKKGQGMERKGRVHQDRSGRKACMKRNTGLLK